MNDWIGLLLIFVLVLANGFFVAAEFALVSVRKTRIDQLVAEGSSNARVVKKITDQLDLYIAATQLGITMASLALGAVGERTLEHLVDPLVHVFVSGEGADATSTAISTAISFAIVTALHIVFGELAPKTLALQKAEATSLAIATPLRIFTIIFRPFIVGLNFLGNAVVRLFGLKPSSGHEQVHSPDELELLIEQAQGAGLLDATETEMLHRVFDFSERSAYEVMVPRVDMVAIATDAPLERVLIIFKREHYTRYPVYDGSTDNIVGVLHTKDMIAFLADQMAGAGRVFDIRKIMRPALAMPEGSSIEKVLAQMKATGNQMAILIDEYGGTAGIITIEDITEEIVGDVEDEFDVQYGRRFREMREEGSGTLLVSGRLPLDRLNERLNSKLESEFSSSVGGWLLGELGHLPDVGERVTVGDYQLEVVKLRGKRIESVRVVPVKAAVPVEVSSLPTIGGVAR